MRSYIVLHATSKIDIRLTSQIFGKPLSLPMEFFERNLAGVISKHMQQDQKIREFLTGDFLKTSGIRYEIRYRRVTFTERSHIFVDYTYAAAWKLPGVRNDEWHHQVADNRLDLVRDAESFKIVAGM